MRQVVTLEKVGYSGTSWVIEDELCDELYELLHFRQEPTSPDILFKYENDREYSTIAQYNIGVMYDRGDGVQKDPAKAVEYFQRAANEELPRAMYNLGVCYELGEGVTKDVGRALEWYRKAILRFVEFDDV